jgi:hypothetical protein
MKTLKILIQPFDIKGDEEDTDQLQQDVYEKVLAMVESETLAFEILEDEEEESEDY